MGRKKPREATLSIANAVSQAFGEIDSLKEELNEWYDNMPEGPKNGDKGDQLQTAIDTLEQDSEPTVPSEVESFDVTYNEVTGARLSRADRCSNAVSMVSAVIDYVTNYMSELDKEADTDELDTFVNELEAAKENWEGVEFPGMFG